LRLCERVFANPGLARYSACWTCGRTDGLCPSNSGRRWPTAGPKRRAAHPHGRLQLRTALRSLAIVSILRPAQRLRRPNANTLFGHTPRPERKGAACTSLSANALFAWTRIFLTSRCGAVASAPSLAATQSISSATFARCMSLLVCASRRS